MAVLAKIRGLSAIGAATVAEARALIQEAAPQVVVLDMRLPDGTGLDVIAALEAAGANAVVIIASAYLDDYRGKLSRSERLHLLGKPVPMHELRRIVEGTMSNTNVLGPFTVIDYVQLACMGHHSAVIECVGSAGRGEIIIERGELWSASDGAGTGRDAFERLLLAKKATAQQLGPGHARVPRNLTERWELLILDTLRTQDEQSSSASAAAAKSASPAAAPAGATTAHTAAAGPAAPKVAASTPAAAPVTASANAAPAANVAARSQPADPVAQVKTAGPGAITETANVPVAGLGRARSASPAPARVEPPRVEPPRVEPSRIAPTRVEPARSESTSPAAEAARREDGFDACVERALRAVVAKNFTVAIAELERAQLLRPDDPMVKHRLARLRSLQS